MSRGELAEWLLMIGVIVSWWPLIFLGWSPVAYRVGLYAGSGVILAVILVRRVLRLQEGLLYSRRIIQQQHALRFGRRPPLGPGESDNAVGGPEGQSGGRRGGEKLRDSSSRNGRS